MAIKALQDKFANAMAKAEELRQKYAGKSENMTPDEERQFDAYLDEADGAKKEIVRLNKEESLKGWQNESAGRLRIAGGATRDADDVEDNEPLVGDDDPTVKAFYDRLFSKMDSGMVKAIKATRKPGYKSALDEYIRCQGRTELMSAKAFKDLSGGADSEGGYWVPEDFRLEIIKKLPTMAEIRGLARVLPTSRDIVTFPTENYTADDKFTSAVRMTWVDDPDSDDEADADDNDPGQLHIYVRTGMVGKKINKNLLEDSAFDMLGYVQGLFVEGFALGENDAFLTGNGRGKPVGLFNSNGANFPVSVNNGHATQIQADGLIEIFYALPKQYRNMAKWILNSQTAKAIRKLKDGDNRYLWDSMNGGLASSGDQDTLLNKSVVIDEFCPDIAAGSYPIAFGDPQGYYILDRIGMSIEVLREKYAERNRIKVLGRKRLGGDVAEPWRFRMMKMAA